MQNTRFHLNLSKIKRTSAGAILLKQIPSHQDPSVLEWHTLLLRGFGHWDFPKGQIEEGENMKTAAIREVFEETGIKDLHFPWGTAFARTSLYSRDKVAYYCLSQTNATDVALNPNPQTGEIEHDAYQWVKWEDTPLFLSPRLFHILDWASATLRIPTPPLTQPTASLNPSSTPLTEQSAVTAIQYAPKGNRP